MTVTLIDLFDPIPQLFFFSLFLVRCDLFVEKLATDLLSSPLHSLLLADLGWLEMMGNRCLAGTCLPFKLANSGDLTGGGK